MAGQFVCDDGLVAQTCVMCDAEITDIGKGSRPKQVCSTKCFKARAKVFQAQHRLRRGYRRVKGPDAICEACKQPFRPRLYSKAQVDEGRGKFCSLTCRSSVTKIHASRLAGKIASEKRRRARKRGADAECFSEIEIYERDNWRCGICGTKVDRRLAFPHKMSASLDHIVPLAAGGSHTRRNVQCSHWLCNSRKTSGAGGQLRLFG